MNSCAENKKLKEDLALTYQMLAYEGMDDLTYAHCSVRSIQKTSFYIAPLGLLFSEVRADNLLEVTWDGQVIHGHEAAYNQTGFVIHGSLYKARSDLNAVIHLHTTAGVAVSSMACGLRPLSQFSFHFYNRIAYHDYNSLALSPQTHGQALARDLNSHHTMILRNHGTLTCGSTLHQAFFYAYYLEQACKVQCLALNSAQPLIEPSREICEQAAQDMRAFEDDLGYRDWHALARKVQKFELSR